jgi:hypothetical protein
MSDETGVVIEFPSLPKGVAYKGLPCTPIYNVHGNVVLLPLFVDPPIKKKSDFPISHYLLKKSENQLLCLLCNKTFATQEGKLSNGYDHIYSVHWERVPPQYWSENNKLAYEKDWDKRVSEATGE